MREAMRAVSGVLPAWSRTRPVRDRLSIKLFPILLLLLFAGTARAQEAPGTEALLNARFEEVAKAITLYLARFVEMAAALVVGIASLRALWRYFAGLGDRSGQIVPQNAIRLSLGRSLALALEFELGADILKTAVAPTWSDIGQLAAIAVLRTALNYFLERELERAQRRDPATPATEASQ